MASLCNTIRNKYNKYIEEIPKELPTKATQGFVVTSVISLFAGSTIPVAIFGGSIAVLASTIEALTRPIIKFIFPEDIFVGTAIQAVLPEMVALKLANMAEPWIGLSYKMTNLVFPVLGWMALNFNNWYEKNIAVASVL